MIDDWIPRIPRISNRHNQYDPQPPTIIDSLNYNDDFYHGIVLDWSALCGCVSRATAMLNGVPTARTTTLRTTNPRDVRIVQFVQSTKFAGSCDHDIDDDTNHHGKLSTNVGSNGQCVRTRWDETEQCLLFRTRIYHISKHQESG